MPTPWLGVACSYSACIFFRNRTRLNASLRAGTRPIPSEKCQKSTQTTALALRDTQEPHRSYLILNGIILVQGHYRICHYNPLQ